MPFDIGYLVLQLCDLGSAGENTAVVLHRTSGKGASGIYQLTVKGDDSDLISERLCGCRGIVDVVENRRPAEHIADDHGIFLIKAEKPVSHSDIAPLPLQLVGTYSRRLSLYGGYRIKRRAPAVRAFQVGNRRLRRLFVFGYDVLDIRAESRLYGNAVFRLQGDEL